VSNADPLFQRLVDLTKRWNTFEDVPPSQRSECAEIGRKLYDLGGEPMMQRAYYHAHGHNRAAHVVAAYWDGIGDWRW
jgi:hypothetical protein